MTPRNTLLLAGVVGALLFGWGLMAHERAVGALEVLLKQATIQHRADSLNSVKAVQVAQLAVAQSDSLRRLARLEVVKDAKVHAHTDSVLRHSAASRDSATRLLADSSATREALRGELRAVVDAGLRDSAAFAATRHQDSLTIRALLLTVHADSLTIYGADTTDAQGKKVHRAGLIDAQNAAIQRATSAEAQVGLMRRSMPSGAGNLVRYAVVAGAVYFVAKR